MTTTSKLTKVKVGQGYWQSGYGRGFKKNPIVWLINGKCYVKDSNATPFETDLEGYIMVNKLVGGSNTSFSAVGIITEHKQY